MQRVAVRAATSVVALGAGVVALHAGFAGGVFVVADGAQAKLAAGIVDPVYCTVAG